MPPAVNNKNNASGSSLRKKGSLYIIVFALVILVVVAAYLVRANHLKHVTDYSYQGQKLSPISVGGLNFSKPAEFTKTLRQTDDKYDVAAFTHTDKNSIPVGYLMAISHKDTHASDKKYIHDVNAVMALGSKNADYNKYVAAIRSQVYDSYKSSGYTVQLGGATKFINTNIKSNAWSFDVTAANSNAQVQPMQGRLIYIIAPGTLYYLSVMTINDNWVSNQATWQQMTNSIKVN